jgi:hypothetical protein
MKKVILLVLLMPFPAFGQIFENFESGNIVNWTQSTEGRWKADTTASLSGKYSLHHIFDNPEAGIDRIGIRIKNLHPALGVTRWSFLVRFGYDPSSLNNWSVFLISDNGPETMSPDGVTKGFALGVNLIGSDDTLRLWKVNGSQISTVVNCRINWQTDIGTTTAVKFIVERTQDGNWTVTIKRLTGSIIGISSGTDKELFNQMWFEVYYRYSSTRDMLLWLDDINIEGVFYEDSEAPTITGSETCGKNSVKFMLNEEPAPEIMVPENFSLNSLEKKSVSVVKESNLTYRVRFDEMLINRSVNTMIINNICDVSGNCNQNIRLEFTPSWAEAGDLIISEIMADPLPQVSLPEKEYIELTNRSGYSINLKDWTLSTEGQSALLPETIINPSEIIIVCAAQDTFIFKKFGKVAGMKQFPSLTDAGRLLYISDSAGTFIHGMEYSSKWYNDDLKSQGGWSLEMIDTGFPFYYQDNWIASESKKGGTPGLSNSVSESNCDRSFYGIQNVFPDDSISIRIRFSEPVLCFEDKAKYIKIGNRKITEICQIDPLFREFMIKVAEPLQRSELYQISLPEDICDFAGNRIQKYDFSFGLSESAEKGDVLFNEILFNPLPGDPDYIELYNNSKKIVNVSRLQIVSVNDATSDRSKTAPVSDQKKCFLPGGYYTISTSKKRISERYFSADPDHIFETESLPSMSDNKGHLILYNRELDNIDEIIYNDNMHYSLLVNHEGVALEKTTPGSRSDESLNWHSATESSGWGTPGAPNSVFAEVPPTTDRVILSSSKITPDNYGNDDFLAVFFNLKGNSNVVSISVFDEAGNFVRKLASNLYIGTGTSIIWDGTADDGSPVRTGIYIILITLYDDTGKTVNWKKVCTVIRN